jgi:DNA polymerase-3 subunit chi
MGQARFYQMTRSPLDVLALSLLERALAQGWRVEVRGTQSARMTWLDERLWSGQDDGFLPHGLAGNGAQDALQPVLLTLAGTAATNGAQALMAVDGADVSLPELRALERVWVLFDGTDAESLERARAQWRTLVEAGASAQYWSEESGRWQMKAER